MRQIDLQAHTNFERLSPSLRWHIRDRARRARQYGPIPVATVPLPETPREAQLIVDAAALDAGADTIVAARVLHRIARSLRQRHQEGYPMGKLNAVAERIKAKHEVYGRKADDWNDRLDQLDRREPDAFAMGDAAIEEKEVELGDMESMVRGLSNLPNVSGSGQS